MNTTNNSNFKKRKLFFFPLFIIGFFGMSAVVMLLWNWIIPSISTFAALTYWKAMGLLVLSKILFGGFHFNRHKQKMHQHFEQHAPFKDKFLEMTDEEKNEFKNQFKSRCCR
jgi:hypothetical protein